MLIHGEVSHLSRWSRIFIRLVCRVKVSHGQESVVRNKSWVGRWWCHIFAGVLVRCNTKQGLVPATCYLHCVTTTLFVWNCIMFGVLNSPLWLSSTLRRQDVVAFLLSGLAALFLLFTFLVVSVSWSAVAVSAALLLSKLRSDRSLILRNHGPSPHSVVWWRTVYLAVVLTLHLRFRLLLK